MRITSLLTRAATGARVAVWETGVDATVGVTNFMAGWVGIVPRSSLFVPHPASSKDINSKRTLLYIHLGAA
jgi:hypothetical protein